VFRIINPNNTLRWDYKSHQTSSKTYPARRGAETIQQVLQATGDGGAPWYYGIPAVGPALESGDQLDRGEYVAAAVSFVMALVDVFTLGQGTEVRLEMNAAKGSTTVVEEVAVHGNSLKSLKPTWGYKLYSNDGTFLKNGITSKLVPQSRYTRAFMSDKIMVPIEQFPNRAAAWEWEFQQNLIQRGPLNLNMH
jgi:hypothetical protein